MDAVHLMRAITGRDLIIKVEGCYHGHHDSVQVSVSPEPDEVGPGQPARAGAGQHRHPRTHHRLTLVVGVQRPRQRGAAARRAPRPGRRA